MTRPLTTSDFERDVQDHGIQIIRDDGLYRHLRFARPRTMCMHFDILTWPGHLCYTGDMGTYVFSRLRDMLSFFRAGPGSTPYRIDFRYWGEKALATDKCDGIKEFSPSVFKLRVHEHVESVVDGDDDWTPELCKDLWSCIEDEVFGPLEDGEHFAWTALHDFAFHGGVQVFRFTDWESSCTEFTYHFLWCCHALEWGIRLYDKIKAEAQGPAPKGDTPPGHGSAPEPA